MEIFHHNRGQTNEIEVIVYTNFFDEDDLG